MTPEAFVYSNPPFVVKEARVVACPLATLNPPFAEIRPDAVSVPVIEVLSRSEMLLDPESITMFPVLLPPRVKVWPFVV